MQQAYLFCRIIRRDTPANFVHEDDLVVAFNDLRPQSPVHLLVLPRKHIPTLNDLTPEDNALIGQTFQVAKKLAVQSNIHQKGLLHCLQRECRRGPVRVPHPLHALGRMSAGRRGRKRKDKKHQAYCDVLCIDNALTVVGHFFQCVAARPTREMKNARPYCTAP